MLYNKEVFFEFTSNFEVLDFLFALSLRSESRSPNSSKRSANSLEGAFPVQNRIKGANSSRPLPEFGINSGRGTEMVGEWVGVIPYLLNAYDSKA